MQTVMMSSLRLALAGGGGAEESRLIDAYFAQWIGSKGRILYLPIALRSISPFKSAFDWIKTTLAPFGLTDITMWTDLSQYGQQDINTFDGVYIGGGNTYSLLAEIKQHQFDQYLTQFAKQGGAIYGGSAGAAILGKSIETIHHIDSNQIGLDNFRGLNLVDDHSVWVHYQPQEDEQIQSFVKKYQHPIFAISEKSGIILENGVFQTVGFEPAYRFDKKGKNDFMQNGTKRNALKIGQTVAIVQKQDQRSGKLTKGIIQQILTKSSTHPHGIKVRLRSGIVGRVKQILPSEGEE